jgi:hypothetical protein
VNKNEFDRQYKSFIHTLVFIEIIRIVFKELPSVSYISHFKLRKNVFNSLKNPKPYILAPSSS